MITAPRALVAGQLAVIVIMGLVAAATVDIFSDKGFGDEPSHVAYVQTVAEDHRLPVLDRDKVSREVAALRTGRDPDVGAPPPRGLAGEQYEAFQPPLYYLVAAPVFLVTDDWFMRVRLVRALGVFFLLLAAFVIYHLARLALPDGHLVAFSAALTVMMWPGVLVMSATVSNASLEILAVCAIVYALWRADSETSARWLLLAGAAVGLGILTKFTVAALGVLLVVVVGAVPRSQLERPALARRPGRACDSSSTCPAMGRLQPRPLQRNHAVRAGQGSAGSGDEPRGHRLRVLDVLVGAARPVRPVLPLGVGLQGR